MKYLNDIYNVDSYKAIKEIPDKSIDLIYTDIPYLMKTGGGTNDGLCARIQKVGMELGLENSKKSIQKRIEKLTNHLNNEQDFLKKKSIEKQISILNSNLQLERDSIVDGIDYSILDDFVRVLKHIYIYIYGAQKTKYTI